MVSLAAEMLAVQLMWIRGVYLAPVDCQLAHAHHGLRVVSIHVEDWRSHALYTSRAGFELRLWKTGLILKNTENFLVNQ